MSPTRDPGWRPALGLALRIVFLPFGPARGRRHALYGVRALYLAAPIQLGGLLIVLGFLLAGVEARPPLGRWPLVIAGYGTLSVCVVAVMAARGFPTGGVDMDDLRSVGSAVRAILSISYAFAMGPALFGFVGVFISGSGIGTFALGLPFSALAFVIAAPTERRIAAMTQRLRARGSMVDVLEALMLPDSDLPGWGKR